MLFHKSPNTYDVAKTGLLIAIAIGDAALPTTRSELAAVIDNYKATQSANSLSLWLSNELHNTKIKSLMKWQSKRVSMVIAKAASRNVAFRSAKLVESVFAGQSDALTRQVATEGLST